MFVLPRYAQGLKRKTAPRQLQTWAICTSKGGVFCERE